MQITTAKLKNAAGGFEDLGIGADANYITLTNGENFEEAAAEVNNETSHMDLQYEILDTEMRATSPVDVALTRNIAEFSSRELQSDITKMNRARVKNADGWSEDIPIGAAAVNIDLNNDSNVEDTLEALEVKHTLLNNKEQELLELIPRIEAEDSIIAIENADMNDSDFRIEGGMNQSTYSGKNLYPTDINTFNVGTTLYGYYQFKDNEDDSYTLSFSDRDTSVSIANMYIGFTKNGINADQGYTWLLNSRSITTANSALTSKYKYISFFPNNQTTFDALCQRFNIQLEKGSSATAYEPYVGGTASPNPDYPQDIDIVTGDVKIGVSGKNLFDKDNPNNAYGSNVTFSSIDSGVRLTSVSTEDSSYRYRRCVIGKTRDFLGKTLKVTTTAIPSDSTMISLISIGSWDGTAANAHQLISTSSTTGTASDLILEYTFPTSFTDKLHDEVYLQFYLTVNTSITPGIFMDYTNVFVTIDTTATDYEPYNGESHTLSLGSMELVGNDTYGRDYIWYNNEDGNWYKRNVWRRYDVTSSSSLGSLATWATNHINTMLFSLSNRNNRGVDNGQVYCNCLTCLDPIDSGRIWGMDVEGIGIVEPDRFDISISKSRLNSSDYVTSAKLLLKDTWQAFWYYPLETPTDTLITDSNLISQLNVLLSSVYQYDKKYYIITDDKNLSLLSMDYTQDLERKVIQNLDF